MKELQQISKKNPEIKINRNREKGERRERRSEKRQIYKIGNKKVTIIKAKRKNKKDKKKLP